MKQLMKWVDPLPKVVKVRFSENMDRQIKAFAKKQNFSYSDAVRILVLNGLSGMGKAK